MPSSSPSVSLEDAISTAEQTLSGTYYSDTARLEFLALEDGSVALTHAFHIQNDTTGDWFDAFVDAHENKVLSVTDFVARASVSTVKDCVAQGRRLIDMNFTRIEVPRIAYR